MIHAAPADSLEGFGRVAEIYARASAGRRDGCDAPGNVPVAGISQSTQSALRAQRNIQVAIAHGADPAFDDLACSDSHHHATSHHAGAHHWTSYHPRATTSTRNEELAHVAHLHPIGIILVMHRRFAGFGFGSRRPQQLHSRSSQEKCHSFQPGSP